MIRQYLSTLLDWLYPKQCLGCRKSGDYLCPDCLLALPVAEENPLSANLAVFAYRDRRLKKAIWLLKYRGVKSLAPLFAKLLYDRLAEELAEVESLYPQKSKWLVTPVPQGRRRGRQRGFNQAAELARELVRFGGPEIFEYAPDVLQKIRETPSQVSLGNRERRLSNLRGAFGLDRPTLVAGRRVIVVDDVITTGGTMREARRALKAAGAKLVLGAAVAAG